MIKVDRSRVETPSCLRLDDTDSPALKEQKKAIAHFTKPRQTKGFDFNVYRRAEIKQAFRLLFFDKCAYCESRYAATQHWFGQPAQIFNASAARFNQAA